MAEMKLQSIGQSALATALLVLAGTSEYLSSSSRIHIERNQAAMAA
jgi:hypothetical protein